MIPFDNQINKDGANIPLFGHQFGQSIYGGSGILNALNPEICFKHLAYIPGMKDEDDTARNSVPRYA